MKNIYKNPIILIMIVLLSFLCQIAPAQTTFDPEDNFYDITTYWDLHYDSIMNIMGPENMEGTGYKHYMHWKTEWEPKVQPTGDFLPYLQAKETAFDCYSSLEYFDPNGSWEEIGPVTSSDQGTNDVGRLSCIEIDPANDNIVLCGSPMGGLYYTVNKGANWINAGLDRPYEEHGLEMFTPGIASIIITHENNITYWIVATGDKDHNFSFSRGVIRSTDNGQSWQQMNGSGNNILPGNWYFIRKLIQHPDYPNIIFAATSRGIYKTINALEADPNDVEWVKIVDDPNSNGEGFFDLEFHRTNPNIMFLSREYRENNFVLGNEIQWSQDGGNSWATLPGANQYPHLPIGGEFVHFQALLELPETNSNLIYIYVKGKNGGYYNKMWKYKIMEEEWIPLSCPFSTGNGRNGFAVSPIDENLIYAATINTYVSTDGGLSWNWDNDYEPINGFNKKKPHSDVQDLKFNVSGTEIWAASDGGPFYKNVQNPNAEWENKVNEIGVANIHYFDQSKIDPNFYVFGGFDVHSQLYDKSQGIWMDKGSGDGYGCAFDNEEIGTYYVTAAGILWRFLNWNYVGTSNYGNPPYNFWNIHVKINTGDHNVLYTTYENEVARSFNQGANLENLVSIDDLGTDINNHLIYDVHTAEGNSNYLYLRVIRKGNGDFPRIYKTTNVNETDPSLIIWGQPLVPPSNPVAWVGDIIVDYENPDRFWACYSNATGDKIWEYDGTAWTDLTYNLADCYTGIGSLEHFHGTDRGLFASGSHGIFYLEDGSSTWKLYKPGFPNVGAVYLKINYCTGKLLAGTRGRGLWETSLPGGWDNAPEITANTTWEGYRIIANPVHIPNGITLTIKGKVAFKSNGKIIVERGGQLILDGAYLTNTCGELWGGIEVWGDPTLSHTLGNQGKVAITNGTLIEHAKVAVRTAKVDVDPTDGSSSVNLNFSGGIVQAAKSEFRNNRNAIIFNKYPATGYTHQSTSFFSDCDFKTDDFYEGETGPGYFVRLKELNVVRFTYCRFNNSSATAYNGRGIYSFNSQFSVEGKKLTGGFWQNSTFNNLEYGIYVLGRATERFADIRHTSFNTNFRGIYISAVNHCRVTSNDFILPEPWETDGGYGLYLDHSTGFQVEDNLFSGEPPLQVGVGIIVNDAGPEPNMVYRNSFSRVECGIETQNENRAPDGTGLVLKCNDYQNTLFDEVVTWDAPVMSNRAGIATSQGSPGSNPEDMAGNLFDIHDPVPSGDFDDILNEANHITYFYPQNYDPLYWNVKPIDYTTNTVMLEDETITPDNWTFEDGCPPSEEPGGGGTGSGGLKDKMAETGLKIDSTENLLSLLIDGGNTEATQTEVASSVPPETMQVYNELMAKSPYLSDTVVGTAIEKEDVLPGAMIRDIMVANPKAAKSDQLISKLDQRWEPLPEYMKAQILAGRSIVSIREETESKLAAYKMERENALNMLTRHYLTDTLNPNASKDSLVALLQNETSLAAKYQLVYLYSGQGAWYDGLAILDNMPTQFDLTPDEAATHTQFINYYSLLSEIAQQGNSILEADSSQVASLMALEAGSSGLASTCARNILLALDEMGYNEIILLPDMLKSTQAMSGYEELLSKANTVPGFMVIKPNPAKDYIIAEYDLPDYSMAVFHVNDITGNLIYSNTLQNNQDQIIIDTRGWKAGVYVCTIKLNGKLVESVKFTVID